jgi:hypothetical protein
VQSGQLACDGHSAGYWTERGNNMKSAMDILKAQQQAELDAAIRAGKTGVKLLADADMNIGNSNIIQPAVSVSNVGTVLPNPSPPRILNLTGKSSLGQTTTVAIGASRIAQGANNPLPGFAGPLTGIIEFGSGGRDTKVEIDLPIGPFMGSLNAVSSSEQTQDGGVMITVPTSVLRVYARYDNLLLSPVLGTEDNAYPTGKPLAIVGGNNAPIVGPGGPSTVVDPQGQLVNIPAEPVQVKAMAAYYAKTGRSRAYKTLYLYCSNDPLTGIVVQSPTIIGGFSNFAFFSLPAYCKTVKVLRFPDLTNIEMVLHNGIRPVDYYNFTGGTSAPIVDVEGGECIVGLKTAAQVTFLALACEIGV